jgi:hypothetical protein
MVDRDHPVLSIVRQCELVSVNRSGLYYGSGGETALNLALMRLIDAQFMETPWYGSRGRPQARAPTDGRDRPRADLPTATHDDPASGASDLPLSAARLIDPAEPGLVHGYHLYSDATRISVSCRDYGLVDA